MSSNKKKKKSSFLFRKLLIIPLFAANCIAALGLFFAFLAQYISPVWFSYSAFCGLGFIYIFVLNAVFVILWLPIKYPYALLSLSLILLNVGTIDKHFQLQGSGKPHKCVDCVKVMSYNVKLFGLYDTENQRKLRQQKKNEVFHFIKEEQPDIVCFQEYFYDKSGKLNFNTTDTLLSILKLKNKNFHYEYFTASRGGEFFYGLAIFSKNKIVGKGIVEMPDSTVIASYIEFKHKNDTVRVYNCHLASVHFKNEDYELGKQLKINAMNDPKWQKKAKVLYEKLNIAFEIRTQQSKILKRHLKNCPHYVIVCGDLNDSPASFAYNKVASSLKDSFRESGKGMGETYLGETFPKFRIDYILHDNAYKSYGHTVCTNISISDHYPVYSWISLLRN